MTVTRACIEKDRLRDHLDGALSDDEAIAIVAHLDACDHCQRTLETLADGGELVELARSTARGGARSNADNTVLLSLLETLKRPPAPAAVEDELPDQLGHYRVLEVAGRGGMGVAFKALDTKLGRVVCLKAIAESLAASPSARQRLLREARAAASIDSQHVVKIFAVEEDALPPYLAMEYVEGELLQALLDDGPLPIERILEIGTQVAAGLSAAHAQGVVHRDIKPGNILIEAETGCVKIMDFGLARSGDDGALTTEGAIAGTPEYMAPEQARGEAVDWRADLFSLGSLLHAMCIGRSPFRADNSLAVLRRILDDTPPPLDRLRRDVPAGLSELVRRLHMKCPEKRVQSADEVRQTLDEIAAGTYVPARIGRRAWLLAASGALVGTAGLAVAWGDWSSPTTRNSLPVQDDQNRNRTVAVAPARHPRVLIVMPAEDFYAPDFYPVAMWLGTHGVKYQVASTNMHRCQPDERGRNIAEHEGKDITVQPDLIVNYARPSQYDAVYFVGGTGSLVYAEGGSHAEVAQKLIAEFLRQEKVIAAMGIAPIILAEADVLRGRRATCYPFSEPPDAYQKRLESAGAVWTDEAVVEDGPFVTCGRPRFVEEFAHALLRRLGVEPRSYLLPEPGG